MRCLGITKKFKFCGRHGNWILFCDDHKWSFFKLIALAAAIFAFIPNYKAVEDYFFDPRDKFYGAWEERFDFPYQNGNAHIEGEVTYFKNGRYNFSGKFKYSITVENIGLISVGYDASAAGTWIADESTLTISREDHEYKLQTVNTGLGEKIDELFKNKMLLDVKSQDKLLNGINDQYHVLELSESAMTLEGSSPDRKKFIIHMNKI